MLEEEKVQCSKVQDVVSTGDFRGTYGLAPLRLNLDLSINASCYHLPIKPM